MAVHGIPGHGGGRRIVVLLAFAATTIATISAAMFARPVPADAAGVQLCESSGSFCVSADNLDNFTPVVERNPGRDLVIQFDQSVGEWTMSFVRDPSKCVAAANNLSDVVIHPCAGSHDFWALGCDGSGHEKWKNVDSATYLSGHDNGTQFVLEPFGATNHVFQRFDDVLNRC